MRLRPAKLPTVTPREAIVHRTYTPKTLAPFNGTDRPEVYLAVLGEVYDVSKGRTFYGPGGPYENFAGRDASRGLAKGSFDAEMLTDLDKPIDKLDDLTEEEKTAVKDWKAHFDGKYLVVGRLVENGDPEADEDEVAEKQK